MSVVLSEFFGLTGKVESSLAHFPFMCTLKEGRKKVGMCFCFFAFVSFIYTPLGCFSDSHQCRCGVA